MTLPYMPSQPPSPEEIHCWRLRWKDVTVLCKQDSLRVLLTDDERGRAGLFVLPEARSRFVAGRATLRWILAHYTARVPAEIVIRYERYGKPRLDWPGDHTRVEFSVSHSEGLIVLAFTGGEAVGVDIERARELADVDSLAERFFTPLERWWLAATPVSARSRLFLQLWTRKEAVLKANGTGLSGLSDALDVSKEGRIAPHSELAAGATWHVHDLLFSQGENQDFVGAYACARAAARVKWFDVLPSLLDATNNEFSAGA